MKYQNITHIIVFVIFITSVLVAVFLIDSSIKDKNLNYPNLNNLDISLNLKTPDTTISNVNKVNLKVEQIVKDLNNVHGLEFSFYFYNLNDNSYYSFNKTNSFNTASLYKLWVMALIYQKVNNNELKLNTVLSKPVSYLNNKFLIPPQYASRSEGTVEYTVEEALYKMIAESDNESALLLTDYLGAEEVENYMQSSGYKNTFFGLDEKLPQTNAEDVYKFYKNLYLGKVVNKKYSDEMLQILKQQTFNHKAAKYIPNNIEFAHKTGELEGDSHDAGLVFLNNNPYILIVLTKSNNPEEANEFIAKLSKDIFVYINSL